MTEYQFWHGDMKLLEVYYKAYIRNKDYTAWIQGNYNNIAMSVAYANAWSKKNQKKEKFPEWKDPFAEMDKPKENISKENIEEKAIQERTKQQQWLKNILKK